MLKNYLTIAYRNLLKNKVFSLINILGLAIGMAACLLILQYVSFELSYDEFHERGDQIYRIRYDYTPRPDLLYSYATTYAGVGPRIQELFPGVIAYTRLHLERALVSYGETTFEESQLCLADASFFQLFSYPLLEGNPDLVLKEPNTAVFSQSAVKKYFGEEDPVGKTVLLEGRVPVVVTGVMKDMPANSHLKLDVLISFSTLNFIREQAGLDTIEDNWRLFNFYTYLQLQPGTNSQALEAKLPEIVRMYRGEDMLSIDKFLLQPLQDIHLHSHLIGEAQTNGSEQMVIYLSIIALFILIIAWINYVNLSTAQSMKRAREVGMRKVMGSQRYQIVKQLMLESLLLNGVAIVLAFTIAQFSLPFLQSLLGNSVTFVWGNHGIIYTIALFIFLCMGFLLSSFYPAFVLSAFHPIAVLKGTAKGLPQGVWLRRSLVVFQFSASVVLIAGTFTMYQQLSFMRNQNLGINIQQTLVVKAPRLVSPKDYTSKMEAFTNDILRISTVETVTSSSDIPGKKISNGRDQIRRAGDTELAPTTYKIYYIDEEFIPTYGVNLKAGRNFSPAMSSDSNAVLLNEKAVTSLGFASAEAAVNEKIIYPEKGPLVVVGVIENFHQQGFKEEYEPILFFLKPSQNYISLKINTGDQPLLGLTSSIQKIKSSYEELFPGNPFDYFFLDDFFGKQYQADRQFGQVFTIFSALAILVACLGLSGLSSYTTIQRTKEIGIRKVMGASVQNIVTLLSKDYIKLIFIASLLALPIAYLLIQKWLENYAFRIDIGWWLLLVPVLVVLLIALLTVSFQTIKTALTNPVKSLRYE